MGLDVEAFRPPDFHCGFYFFAVDYFYCSLWNRVLSPTANEY